MILYNARAPTFIIYLHGYEVGIQKNANSGVNNPDSFSNEVNGIKKYNSTFNLLYEDTELIRQGNEIKSLRTKISTTTVPDKQSRFESEIKVK